MNDEDLKKLAERLADPRMDGPMNKAASTAILSLMRERDEARRGTTREVRRAVVAEDRMKAWERQVYMVNPFAPLMAIPDTEFGDKVPPVPIVDRVTDLLDRATTAEARLSRAIEALRWYEDPWERQTEKGIKPGSDEWQDVPDFYDELDFGTTARTVLTDLERTDDAG